MEKLDYKKKSQLSTFTSCLSSLGIRHQLWSVRLVDEPLCTVKTKHLFLSSIGFLSQLLVHWCLLCFLKHLFSGALSSSFRKSKYQNQSNLLYIHMLAESFKEVLWFWHIASLYRSHINSSPGSCMYPYIHSSYS